MDIFFRKIVSEINLLRKTHNHLANYKQDYNDNFNNELKNLFNSMKKITCLEEFEWDSDLAEAAEKFLIIYPNDYEKNFDNLNGKMTEIIDNIYPFQKIQTYAIVSVPEENSLICKLLLNWKDFNNIFLGQYNLIGISGLQFQEDKVIFLINMAQFSY